METETGKVLAPSVWCRERWCRENPEAEHALGDGCTCDPHGRDSCSVGQPRLTILKAHASRLAAFACRACGGASRRMVEYPELFFRCEPCAAADRWPDFSRRGARG